MSRPSIENVTAETLPEFAQFLHTHLDSQRSAAGWIEALSNNWCSDRPNYGFALRAEGRIVGGIGALYADRVLAGQTRRVCNITSWCVLDAYRQQSMRLAMALLDQPDTVFTDFSPTKVVSGSLQFLKFKTLDDAQFVLPNLPGLPFGPLRLLHGEAALAAGLDAVSRKMWQDHRVFPWLRFCALAAPGQTTCLVIWKPDRLRGLPVARILHLGDQDLACRGLDRLTMHLLGQGQLLSLVERRQLGKRPRFARIREGFIPKVFRGDHLDGVAIDYLYSETVAMDLP